MKMSCSVVLVLATGFTIPVLHSQQVAGTEAKPKPQTGAAVIRADARVEAADGEEAARIPVVRLSLSDPKPINGVPEFHMWASPIVCGPDGTPFVSVLDPADYRIRPLYSLGEAGGHTFTPAGAPGLYDITLIAQFVGETAVGFLVHATRDDAKRPNRSPAIPGIPAHDVYTGEHESFVIEFDRESGQFRRTVDLPKEYMFLRIAALADDALLVLAYDRANSVPRLLVVDTDGKIVRTLEVPQSMTQNPRLKEGSSGDRSKQAEAEKSMSLWQFAPVRNSVLLYQDRSHAPVLEVGKAGAAREVPLDSPKGYTLESVVPANDRWLMRFRKDGLDDEKAVDVRPETGNVAMYEVDPNDGSLKRQIDLINGKGFETACEVDGTFIGFSIADKVMRVTAQIGR